MLDGNRLACWNIARSVGSIVGLLPGGVNTGRFLPDENLMMTRAFAMLLLALLASTIVATAGRAEVASDSPFGIVCPWPGVQQTGVRWCRVGAGSTAMISWPSIEPAPGRFDWSASDAELKNTTDVLGLSILGILGYTPKWALCEAHGRRLSVLSAAATWLCWLGTSASVLPDTRTGSKCGRFGTNRTSAFCTAAPPSTPK